MVVVDFEWSLTCFEIAFAVTVQRDDQNTSLHVVVSFDAHFGHHQMRFPAIIDRVDSVKWRRSKKNGDTVNINTVKTCFVVGEKFLLALKYFGICETSYGRF